MDFIRSFIEYYLPPNYSANTQSIDELIIYTHYLMFALFLGWGIYFIYVLFRFRSSNNPKASYKGVTSHYSTYIEIGVIVAEILLIFGLAIPKWNDLKLEIPKPQNINISDDINQVRGELLSRFAKDSDINQFFPEDEIDKDMQVIHIIAQTFNYNVHYPGPDGKFGPRHRDLVDDGEGEYIGLDWSHEDSKDDIVLLDELILEVDKPVLIYLTSKDVIHSFFLPEFRVKQDAIPGQKVAIFFTPQMTTKEFLENFNNNDETFNLWEWIADPENLDWSTLDFTPAIEDENGKLEEIPNRSIERGELLTKLFGRDTFQMGCAQLCGSGHSTMNKGDVFIVSKEDYQQWYFGQMWAKNSVIIDEEEEDWDEW